MQVFGLHTLLTFIFFGTANELAMFLLSLCFLPVQILVNFLFLLSEVPDTVGSGSVNIVRVKLKRRGNICFDDTLINGLVILPLLRQHLVVIFLLHQGYRLRLLLLFSLLLNGVLLVP